jgi:leader peptidase (prepilin peptidase) / N-methyltransferase
MEILKIALFAGILIFLALYDLKKGIIPNKVVYPAMAVALVFNLILPANNLIAAIGCGTALALILLIPALLWRQMGMGDVKLAFLMGLIMGFPQGIFALVIGVFLGGLAAIAHLLLRIKGRKDEIPYGPYLAAGTLIVLFLGNSIQTFLLK